MRTNKKQSFSADKQKGALNKGFGLILLIIIIFMVLSIVMIYLLVRKRALPSNFVSNQQVVTSDVPIQTSEDLDKVSAELDSADISSLDTQLDQLDTDAASF